MIPLWHCVNSENLVRSEHMNQPVDWHTTTLNVCICSLHIIYVRICTWTSSRLPLHANDIIFKPKPPHDNHSFHVCWSSEDSFISKHSTSFLLFRCFWIFLGRVFSGVLSPPWPLDSPYNRVAQLSFLPCLQMPETFCASGTTQRSNSHNSMLWTTQEGKCHQRSPQRTLCAGMERLADQCLIERSMITPVLFFLFYWYWLSHRLIRQTWVGAGCCDSSIPFKSLEKGYFSMKLLQDSRPWITSQIFFWSSV